MEILLELFSNENQVFIRTITNTRPNIGDFTKVDDRKFQILDCKLRQDVWKDTGIICYLCKVEECFEWDIVGRISSEIAKKSPFRISKIEAENSGGFGFDKGDIAHDDTYYYLSLGSFEVIEPVSQYLIELEGYNESGSMFDLSIELYDGDEFIINKKSFLVRLSYPWMASPNEMKANDGQLWTILEAVIKKGVFPKFDKYFNDRLRKYDDFF